MTTDRLDEIEKQVTDIPKINITPNPTQSVIIFIVFLGLAIVVTYIAEIM